MVTLLICPSEPLRMDEMFMIAELDGRELPI